MVGRLNVTVCLFFKKKEKKKKKGRIRISGIAGMRPEMRVLNEFWESRQLVPASCIAFRKRPDMFTDSFLHIKYPLSNFNIWDRNFLFEIFEIISKWSLI